LYNPGFVRIHEAQVSSMIRPAAPARFQATHRTMLRSTLGAGAVAATLVLGVGVGHAQQPGAAKKVDVAKGQQVASQVCAACHGADGNATAGPANPKLAGQHADYLYKQLVNFVPKDGKPAERANAIMQGFAQQLSDEDKRNVSAFYATQAKKPSAAKDKQLVELGQTIFRAGIPAKDVPSCAGCHGPAGTGMPAQYPRIAGQWAEYTESQLVQFRGGQRKNSAQMTAIAARMSDLEIKAVSDYIAGLR
jgi:cbb3-type cytochrome c oxidase subunit III